MEILTDEVTWAEARRSVTRYLLGLQVWSFRQLLDALEDPERPLVSWRNPFLRIRRPMPAEWDNEVGPSGPGLHAPQRDLFVALSVLTAGVAVQEIDRESSRLLKPRSIERYLSLFSPGDARRFTKVWRTTGPEWIDYGDEFSPDGRNFTLRGRGRKGTFSAALRFQISPRIVELDESTAFHIRVGLPWRKSKSIPRPDRWTDDERRALRETALGFLQSLRGQGQRSDNELREIRTETPAGNGTRNLDFFAASVESADGVHYLSKVAIKPFAESVWHRFPRYVLGLEGPTLEVTDGQGELLPFYGATIMAAMLYPGDEGKRTEFLAKEHLRRLDEIALSLEEEGYSRQEIEDKLRPLVAWAVEKQGYFAPALVRALRTAPSTDEILRTTSAVAIRGRLVGEMLLTMISCARHHPEHVGLLKANYLLRQGATTGRISVAPSIPIGRSMLNRDWAHYKPVAHLWAAAHLAILEKIADEGPQELVVHLDTEFLAKAEELRRLGEECFARGQRIKAGPVLDPTETWRPPRDLQLGRAEFETDPLPEWSLDRLAQYRAR